MARFFWIILFTTSIHSSQGQSLSALDQDPVFQLVTSKRLVYPQAATQDKIYTKNPIYTFFRINSLGHIQDIQVLNPTGTSYGFELIIKRTLKLLPPLKPAYEGEYILPVRFVYPTRLPVSQPDTTRQSVATYEALNDLLLTHSDVILLKEQRVDPWH